MYSDDPLYRELVRILAEIVAQNGAPPANPNPDPEQEARERRAPAASPVPDPVPLIVQPCETPQ